MEATRVYFSAKCIVPDMESYDEPPNPLVVVKVQKFGRAYGGFDGNYRLYRVIPGVLSGYQLISTRRAFKKFCPSVPEEVGEGYIQAFGNLAWYASCAHGEDFSMDAGGHLFVKPLVWNSGRVRAQLQSYLVTEAPDLDCGHWEGDQLPVWG